MWDRISVFSLVGSGLLALSLTGCVPKSELDDARAAVGRLDRKVNDLEQQLAIKDDEIAEAESENDRLRERVDGLDSEVDYLNSEVNELENDLSAAQQRAQRTTWITPPRHFSAIPYGLR